jgi:hypothetical protein
MRGQDFNARNREMRGASHFSTGDDPRQFKFNQRNTLTCSPNVLRNGIRKIAAIIPDGVELTIDSPLATVGAKGAMHQTNAGLFINVSRRYIELVEFLWAVIKRVQIYANQTWRRIEEFHYKNPLG